MVNKISKAFKSDSSSKETSKEPKNENQWEQKWKQTGKSTTVMVATVQDFSRGNRSHSWPNPQAPPNNQYNSNARTPTYRRL